jgi:hypothetical protein
MNAQSAGAAKKEHLIPPKARIPLAKILFALARFQDSLTPQKIGPAKPESARPQGAYGKAQEAV